ncbi:MAG TPA: NAD(P)-binding domain-containing protein [Jiangellaceae bacterium]|nr:NAD(P)-binding domain-containing protein [Jiangellaceae bacterium]
MSGPAEVDVVVIGAGQAGLSSAHHLQRRGFLGLGAEAGAHARTFLVLDGENGPGGAWRHRWRSLRMATVNGVHDLPGIAQPDVDPCEPAQEAVPGYYAEYEHTLSLPVIRPVHVMAVQRADDDPAGRLLVTSDVGSWAARVVVNATGTWTKPYWPLYPGQRSFTGRQLHVADYRRAKDFEGQHVVVVGGGISAVQLLDEISQVTTTTWVTRREPVFNHEEFTPELGRAAVAMVEERVRAGLPPRSVVSVTGLPWSPDLQAMSDRGVLDRKPMFAEITQDGVRWADGTEQRADVILWATGFRAQLDHLAPLKLRERGGGIVMDGTRVVHEPRVHLVGYGPSASTIGANRAGRTAVNDVIAFLDGRLTPTASR